MTQPLTVFLVDDDTDDCEMFESAVAESGIDCIIKTFHDGCELVSHFLKSKELLPDIIFLDLNMPVLDGHLTLQKIRATERGKRVKVAIFSTSNNQFDQEKTFLSGANLYVQKPSNFRILKQLLEKLLSDPNLVPEAPSVSEFVFPL